MSLSASQKKRLAEMAAELKVSPEELIAEAEAMLAEKTAPSGSKPPDKPPPPSRAPKTEPTPAVEQPKLFMYHLPFVTVNEVRERWLGLEPWSAEEGGGDIAAAFAAVNSGGSSGQVTADAMGDIATRAEHRRSRK